MTRKTALCVCISGDISGYIVGFMIYSANDTYIKVVHWSEEVLEIQWFVHHELSVSERSPLVRVSIKRRDYWMQFSTQVVFFLMTEMREMQISMFLELHLVIPLYFFIRINLENSAKMSCSIFLG